MTRLTIKHLITVLDSDAMARAGDNCDVETLDEIFAGPHEEIFGKITPVNAAFAPPGESDAGSWNLETPGNYAVVCFIPVGAVGETEGDGPPHLTEGMIHEFTVSS